MHKRLVIDTNRLILPILISKCVLQIRCRLLPHTHKRKSVILVKLKPNGKRKPFRYPISISPAVTHFAHNHKSPGNILQATWLTHFGFFLIFFYTEMISTQKILKRLSRTSVQLRQYSSTKGNNTDNVPKSPTQKNKNENSEVCTGLHFLCLQKMC